MKKRWQRSRGADEPYTGSVEDTQPVTRRVLVVEDDESIRYLVALHLRLEKLDVVEAADGQQGLQQARGSAFDLIVLDVMLPGLDGITVCGAIRRESPNSRDTDPDADGAPRGIRQGARSRNRRGRLPDQAVRHP